MLLSKDSWVCDWGCCTVLIVAEEGKRQYHSACSLLDNKEALVAGDHNEAAELHMEKERYLQEKRKGAGRFYLIHQMPFHQCDWCTITSALLSNSLLQENNFNTKHFPCFSLTSQEGPKMERDSSCVGQHNYKYFFPDLSPKINVSWFRYCLFQDTRLTNDQRLRYIIHTFLRQYLFMPGWWSVPCHSRHS